MKIRAPKLPQEAIRELKRVPAELWKPHQLLVAPVYVYLPKNGKFVAVKLPLQYFNDAELAKFKSYEHFYLPEFAGQIEPFRQAGESTRALLVNLRQRRPVRTSGGNEPVLLPLAQHELDAAVLKLMGPLWSADAERGVRVEPFFLCFFANEVCLPFLPERLNAALERDAGLFELALLRSSVAVFLALHVGYADARMLSGIRERVFDATMNETMTEAANDTAAGPSARKRRYVDPATLLTELVSEALRDPGEREISASTFRSILREKGAGGTLARKLLSRLERVSDGLASEAPAAPSLFGEKGIYDG